MNIEQRVISDRHRSFFRSPLPALRCMNQLGATDEDWKLLTQPWPASNAYSQVVTCPEERNVHDHGAIRIQKIKYNREIGAPPPSAARHQQILLPTCARFSKR